MQAMGNNLLGFLICFESWNNATGQMGNNLLISACSLLLYYISSYQLTFWDYWSALKHYLGTFQGFPYIVLQLVLGIMSPLLIRFGKIMLCLKQEWVVYKNWNECSNSIIIWFQKVNRRITQSQTQQISVQKTKNIYTCCGIWDHIRLCVSLPYI